MNKQIAIYILSTAIDKGSILLFFPFLLQIFTLEQFGIWSLIVIVANLLVPLVTLNGSASILREGSENISIGKYLLKKYVFLTFFVGTSIGTLLYFIDNLQERWLFYSSLIATYEGLLILILTYIRAQNRAILFLSINIIKVLIILVIIFFTIKNKIEFSQYLTFQITSMFFFTSVFFFISYFNSIESIKTAFGTVLFFSLSLIPHSMSQWVMSSSDRLIIKYMLGAKDLGIYSLSYNIAQVLTLLNIGLGLALPTYLIKNYSKWKNDNFDNNIIKYYSYIAIFLFIVIYIFYYIDYKYFNLLKYYSSEMLNLITINYLAIYILGLYTFYANYLFYNRKGTIISIVTFYAASFNVVCSVIFIYIFGLIGASIATLFAYVFYLYYIKLKTIQIEVNLNIKIMKNIILVILVMIILRIGIISVTS